MASASVLPLTTENTVLNNAELLAHAVSEMERRVLPGDSFVFFISCHGTFDLTGDEAPVDAQKKVLCLSYRVRTTGDERFYLSRIKKDSENVSDDTFVELFRNERWDRVDKLFIISCCFSGGFWGTSEFGDSGDLATFSWASKDQDTGLYMGNLGQALVTTLEDLKNQDSMTFSELYEAINDQAPVYQGIDGRIEAPEDYWEDEWEIDATAAFAPVEEASADCQFVLDAGGEVIDFGGKIAARYKDAQGHPVTVMLKGPGAGQVVLAAADGVDAGEIRLAGTTGKSRLIVKVKGGRTRVGAINIDAAMGSISAATTDLLGPLTVSGSLGRLVLGDVDAAGVISIGGRADSAPAKVALRRVADTSIDSAMPIRALSVIEWVDTDGTHDQITAPWLGRLAVKGARARKGAGGAAGHFHAGLELGTAQQEGWLGSARIAGDVTGAWHIIGGAGTVSMARLRGVLEISGNARAIRVAEPLCLFQQLGDPWRVDVGGTAVIVAPGQKLKLTDFQLYPQRDGYDFENHLRHYNESGRQWHYNVHFKVNGRKGTDTTTVTVDDVRAEAPPSSGTYYDVSAVSGNDSTASLYTTWFSDEDGVHLTSWSMDLNDGQRIDLTLLDGPLVSPKYVKHGQSHSAESAFDGTWRIRYRGEVISGDCDGQATTTVRLLGMDQVTVPLGTYTAVKGEVTTNSAGGVQFWYDGRFYTGKLNVREKQTFWLAPTVGGVKAVTSKTITVTVPGLAKWSYRLIAAQELTAT